MQKVLFLFALLACFTAAQAQQTGMASYYGKKFHGRKTASGERYDNARYTCAHRKYPFGTILKVTRIDTGDSVLVKVNDRGPFVKGRIIDVSYCAAKDLGFLAHGHIKVRVEEMKDYRCVDGVIEKIPGQESPADSADTRTFAPYERYTGYQHFVVYPRISFLFDWQPGRYLWRRQHE